MAIFPSSLLFSSECLICLPYSVYILLKYCACISRRSICYFKYLPSPLNALNIWDMMVVFGPFCLSQLTSVTILAHFHLIIFLIMDTVSSCLCTSCPLRLDGRCCEFYFVECWVLWFQMLLYFFLKWVKLLGIILAFQVALYGLLGVSEFMLCPELVVSIAEARLSWAMIFSDLAGREQEPAQFLACVSARHCFTQPFQIILSRPPVISPTSLCWLVLC